MDLMKDIIPKVFDQEKEKPDAGTQLAKIRPLWLEGYAPFLPVFRVHPKQRRPHMWTLKEGERTIKVGHAGSGMAFKLYTAVIDETIKLQKALSEGSIPSEYNDFMAMMGFKKDDIPELFVICKTPQWVKKVIGEQSSKAARKVVDDLNMVSFLSNHFIQNKKTGEYLDSGVLHHFFKAIVWHGKDFKESEWIPGGSEVVEKADRVFFVLEDWLRNNIEYYHVLSYDRDYIKSMEGRNFYLKSRIYIILKQYFTTAFYKGKGENAVTKVRYSTLCQRIPLMRHRHKSQAQRTLNPLLQWFVETGYLKGNPGKWKDTKNPHDWLITLTAGNRALLEYRTMQFRRARKKLGKIP